jgi:hypothetical protein
MILCLCSLLCSTGVSLVAVVSPGKLRLAPGPCACTAAQSYALRAWKLFLRGIAPDVLPALRVRQRHFPTDRLRLVCGSVSVTCHVPRDADEARAAALQLLLLLTHGLRLAAHAPGSSGRVDVKRKILSSPTVAGSSLMASPGKLRLTPGPCACTAAQSYALAASSSEAK